MSSPNANQSEANAVARTPSLDTHSRYWIHGADLHLLLGKVLYRVHSYFFVRESKHWKTKLIGSTSSGDEVLLQGNTSTNALVLNEKPADFDCLLDIFYNRQFGDYSHLKLEQWTTVLSYSTKWDFPQVRELAIRYIVNSEVSSEMDTVERIVLYQENKLPEQYLFPLYAQIASREELLSLEESKRLGYDSLVPIHQARERLRSQGSMNNRLLSPIRTDLKPTEIIDIVASTFKISLGNASLNSGSGPSIQLDTANSNAKNNAGGPGKSKKGQK